jgi:hypothetical protein
MPKPLHHFPTATVDFLIVQVWWEPQFTCSCKFVGIDADVLLGPAKNIADEHYDGLRSFLGLRKVRVICGNCAHLDGGSITTRLSAKGSTSDKEDFNQGQPSATGIESAYKGQHTST